MGERKTATYKTITDAGGNRYKIFLRSDRSVGLYDQENLQSGYTRTGIIAWEKEGKKHFNPCHKCGKWVIDAMFNPEVAECVDCAPFEAEAKFCKTCGAKVEVPQRTCPVCGNLLNYEGRSR